MPPGGMEGAWIEATDKEMRKAQKSPKGKIGANLLREERKPLPVR